MILVDRPCAMRVLNSLFHVAEYLTPYPQVDRGIAPLGSALNLRVIRVIRCGVQAMHPEP